jgi:hypothetical protein
VTGCADCALIIALLLMPGRQSARDDFFDSLLFIHANESFPVNYWHQRFCEADFRPQDALRLMRRFGTCFLKSGILT